MMGCLFLLGAPMPPSQTARTIEFFLMSRWNLPLMTPTCTRTGNVASLRLHVLRDSQPPSTSLVTGLLWTLFAFSRAGRGCSHRSHQVPCPPATPQPSHHGEEVVTSAEPTPRSSPSQGSRHLLPPCTNTGTSLLPGGGGLAGLGVCTADSNGSFGVLPSSQSWGAPISLHSCCLALGNTPNASVALGKEG